MYKIEEISFIVKDTSKESINNIIYEYLKLLIESKINPTIG